MNNIESMKKTILEIGQGIKSSSDELNNALSDIKMHEIDLSSAIKKINKQAESAESKFTIAFIGTFSTGKSTIINSLLELKGNARLSSECDPDTAQCVRIIGKDGRNYEAEVDFGGEYPVERVSWSDAKKYTSHVELEHASESVRRRAASIKEVRYYVDSPLLNLCNILDLPGTGSGGNEGAVDEMITNERIMESDCFFWVVTTESEPDPDTLRNLDKISNKILPIINVWQLEREGVSGDYTPGEIIDILNSSYSAYFQSAEAPVVYYAGEIDYAQTHGTEINPGWGKEAFVDKVREILRNIRSSDRAIRIRTNLTEALAECQKEIEKVKGDKRLSEVRSAAEKDMSENNLQFQKLIRAQNIITNELDDVVSKSTNDIYNFILDAATNFINTKMSGVDLKIINRAFRKEGKQVLQKEFETEFEKKYLRLDSGWTNGIINDFYRSTINILKGKYVDFPEMLSDDLVCNLSIDCLIGDMSGIVDKTAEHMLKDMQSKMISMLSSVATTAMILIIPGARLLDEIASFFSIGNGIRVFSDDSKLQAKKELVINDVRLQLRQNQYSIKDVFKTQSKELSENFYNKAYSYLQKEKSDKILNREKFDKIIHIIESFENSVEKYKLEVKELMEG